ncbi:MAG TPA: methyltransferase domain-containing protein [Rudaea sp.]|jgi:SAM-dependent methyltransferase
MDIKETEILGADAENHWYYRSKAEAVERCLHGVAFDSVLDVGAGSGYFSRHLLTHAGAASACCVDPNYPQEWQETVAGKPLMFRRDIGAINADLVLLMDVMEHVDDDVDLLQEYMQKSLPTANFLISVPAFQWLWSAHDDFLGHRRRYTLSQLENTVRAAGLEVVSGNYFYGAIFPIAAAVRFLHRRPPRGSPATSDLRRHGRLVNSTLYALCHAELALMPYNRAFGLSVFCLARRRQHVDARAS